MAKPDITIIGLGNVGKTFLRVLSDNGYSIRSVFSRNPAESNFEMNYPDTYFGEGFPNNDQLGECTFIAVSDDAIADVAQQISQLEESLFGKKFIHFSGALSSEILAPLKEKEALTASFHPIKSITSHTKDFKNIWFDMDGDAELLNDLKKMAEELGANALSVKPEHKTLLHTSAVFTSNYLVVLADLMSQLTNEAGISEVDALKAFAPLMKGTISNLENLGINEALTGPIARGDIQTIKRHLESLEKFPELISFYKKLGNHAVEIAKRKDVESEDLLQIKKLLS